MRAETMTYKNARRTSGFTMVELLIAVIIIGILTAIIVPVLTNRAADARIAAAQADMEAIANAQSQVALDTGYITRLHVLDDSGAMGDGIGTGNPNDVVDSIRDEFFHDNAGNPTLLFLDAKTGRFLLNPSLWDRVEADPEQFGWRGPYVNYQRKLEYDAAAATPDWSYGSPLDPWGNPYFLFVSGVEPNVGGPNIDGFLVDERTGDLENSFNYLTYTGFQTNHFDRNTVLSLGPDGAPGDGGNTDLGTGDDLVRAF